MLLLVENINSAPLCETPANSSNDFEREVEYIIDFDQKYSITLSTEAQRTFREVLRLAPAEMKVGLYLNFCDRGWAQDGRRISDVRFWYEKFRAEG